MDPETKRAKLAAASKCEREVLNKPYPTDGGLYCNRTWDGWGCWSDTKAGSTAFTKCPSFISGFDPRRLAYKVCNSDGTWWQSPMTNRSWANYTPCVDTGQLERDQRVIDVFISGYSLSIVALAISLFIFIFFRQLHCDRITIHINLFISYIVSGVAWILIYTLAAVDAHVLETNPAWCQALHVTAQYFTTCNFFWMFCEGLYLHTLIVAAFTTGKKLLTCCILIGWGIPVFTTMAYTAARASDASSTLECWLQDHPLTWIIVSPVLLTFLVNVIFVCNIIRVLISKMRAVNAPDNNQTKKAVRAIIILIPLLGLQYILFPFRPSEGSDFLEVYRILSATATSFQGFFVALIFCFFNGEVIGILRRKWHQRRLMSTGGGRFCAHTAVTSTETTVHRTRYVDSKKGKPRAVVIPFQDARNSIFKQSDKERDQEVPLKDGVQGEESVTV